MSLEPASDEGLSLGAGGRNPKGPSPAETASDAPKSIATHFTAHVELMRNYLLHATNCAPASGHRGATSQERCATDRPETASPIQHRPARALGRAVGRAWFGLVDRDSYVGGAAQCAGFACDHHAGRTRVGL